MSLDIATPAEWRRSSVSKYCHVQLGKMLQSDPSGDDDELLPYLRAISISKSGVDLSHQFTMWIKPHEKEKFRLKPNDVLVSEGGDAGRTAHFDSEGEYYFQNAINRVRPLDGEQIASRYLFYWFTFLKLAGYVDLICNVATIAHFTAEKVKAAPFAFPPLETQQRIAAFLDEKTAQIDALIARKQALLERLAEKRQAIITHAVTKGLNPAAPLKDSGIDWLGQIPAHWEFIKIKFATSHVVDCLHTTPTYDGDLLYPAIRTADVDRGVLLLDQARLVSQEIYDERIQRLEPVEGDVLYSREGERFGMAALVPPNTPLCLGQRMMMFRVTMRFSPAYVMWTLNSDFIYQQVIVEAGGSTSPHVNIGDVINFPILSPPLCEQCEITEFIEEQRVHIKEMSEKVAASIAKLVEYRSAIVTSAVTGQIEGLR